MPVTVLGAGSKSVSKTQIYSFDEVGLTNMIFRIAFGGKKRTFKIESRIRNSEQKEHHEVMKVHGMYRVRIEKLQSQKGSESNGF